MARCLKAVIDFLEYYGISGVRLSYAQINFDKAHRRDGVGLNVAGGIGVILSKYINIEILAHGAFFG